MHIMMKEVKHKYDNAHASQATQDLLDKVMNLGQFGDWNTCRPPPTKH
jgi:hypothetical protein